MGYVYMNMSNYPLALEYFEKSLKIRCNRLGEEHEDTAASFNSMGLIN
jgi:hypothetical protein